MNRYFKVTENDIVLYVGKNIDIGEEITYEEYLALKAEIEANVPEPVDPKQALIDEIIAEVNA